MTSLRCLGVLAASTAFLLHPPSASSEEAKTGEAPRAESTPTGEGEPAVAPATPATEPKAAPDPEQQAARARELFDEGRKLAAMARYEDACAAFQQSLELQSRASTQFNLADCEERLGRTASAYRLYREVAETLEVAGDAQRAEIASRRADLLKTRLCGVSVEVGKPADGLEVSVDGRPLTADELDEAVAVDPGSHSLRATAPGHAPWTHNLDVESCPAMATVRVPPLSKKGSIAAVAAAPVAKKSKPPPRKEASEPVLEPRVTGERPAEADSSEIPILPVALGTLGVGALVVGVVSAVQFQSKNDAAEAICPTGVGCTTAEIARHAALVEDARNQATWAYVGFGVGAACLVGAGVLFWLELPDDDEAREASAHRLRVSPMVSGDGWGATLTGRF